MGQSSLTLSATTAADLTAKRYYGAKETSSGLALCATLGERCDGVIGVGNTGCVSLERGPKVRLKAGAAFARGANLTVNALGKFVTASTGHHVAFVAAEAATADGDEVDAYTVMAFAPSLSVESVASVSAPGAIPTTADLVLLSVDGTDAFTLDDGAEGHELTIECVAAANTPVGTVTLNGAQAAYGSEPTAWVFNNVGQKVTLRMTATGWKLIAIGQVGTESLTTGQTANPLCLVHFVNLNGANDYIQGAGVIAGQKSRWMATAGTTASTVSGLFYDEDASADGIDVNLDAAGDLAVLEWAGSRWLATSLVSATITT